MLECTGGYTVRIPSDSEGNIQEIDFSQPFRRLSLIGGLEERLGVSLDNLTEGFPL